MVKGISRQVIVVESPEPKLFDQAIFILKENMGEGITDEQLLREAKQVIRGSGASRANNRAGLQGLIWAAAGALVTGTVWLATVLI